MLAFLSGVMRGVGFIRLKRGSLKLVVESLNKELVQRTAYLIKVLYQAQVQIDTFIAEGLSKKEGNKFVLDEKVSIQLLQEIGILVGQSLSLSIPEFIVVKEKNTISYLQGLMVSCGSLSVPIAIDSLSHQSNKGIKRQGYHLELRLNSAKIAEQLVALISKYSIKASIAIRKHYSAIYIKGSEDISDFIAWLGASKSVLALQEIIISRSVRNLTNRQYNCTIANINKSLLASEKQIKAIRLIDKKAGLESLGEALYNTAQIRLANPSANLVELLALHTETLSKSGLNHRLRKLIKIAEELKEE